jgi:hypothetical protein
MFSGVDGYRDEIELHDLSYRKIYFLYYILFFDKGKIINYIYQNFT